MLIFAQNYKKSVTEPKSYTHIGKECQSRQSRLCACGIRSRVPQARTLCASPQDFRKKSATCGCLTAGAPLRHLHCHRQRGRYACHCRHPGGCCRRRACAAAPPEASRCRRPAQCSALGRNSTAKILTNNTSKSKNLYQQQWHSIPLRLKKPLK